MIKEIRSFARGQMRLAIISPDDVGHQITKLIDMKCEIDSADRNHIAARFVKGTLPSGAQRNNLLKEMMADGWVFNTEPRTRLCNCDCESGCDCPTEEETG